MSFRNIYQIVHVISRFSYKNSAQRILITVPPEILKLKDERGETGAVDCESSLAVCYSPSLTPFFSRQLCRIQHPSYRSSRAYRQSEVRDRLFQRAKAPLIDNVSDNRSHPDVAQRHYPDLFRQYFPDGIPEKVNVY